MRNYLVLPTTVVLLATMAAIFAVPAHASTIITPDKAGVDVAITQEDKAFTIPSRIIVAPITAPRSEFSVRDRDWYRGLYYYLVANSNRPGFTDIPFHYVVTQDGRIFKGNKGGEERKVSIQGIDDNAIVIAYLAPAGETTFDARAEDAIGEIVLGVANRNAIGMDRISLTSIEVARNDIEKTLSLRSISALGTWNTSLNRIITNIRGHYKPVPRTYTLEVMDVTLPTAAVNPGETIEGKIKLKNTGDRGIYAGTQNELVATSAAKTSQFYLLGQWASISQFTFMADGEALLPGEEKEFAFKLYVPLYFGQRQEQFDLRTVSGGRVANTNFTIALNVNRPQGTIVEIKPTQTGWLRVRSTPNGVENNEMARASTGERFFQLQDAGNGWVKIKLSDGREGWVSKQYLSYV